MKYLSLILIFICLSWSCRDQTSAQLARIIPSECNQDGFTQDIRNRIISKELKDDSLYLHLALVENCCIEFTPKIKFHSNVLHIDLDTRTGEFSACACNCCFEITMVITGIKNTSFSTILYGDYDEQEIFLSLEKYRTYPEKFEIISGDTVNKINKYGNREGIWYFYVDSSEVLEWKAFFNGGRENENNIIWHENYYKNGMLEARFDQDSNTLYTDAGKVSVKNFSIENGKIQELFHENGRIKSRCNIFNKSDNNAPAQRDSCLHWDSIGNRIMNLP